LDVRKKKASLNYQKKLFFIIVHFLFEFTKKNLKIQNKNKTNQKRMNLLLFRQNKIHKLTTVSKMLHKHLQTKESNIKHKQISKSVQKIMNLLLFRDNKITIFP
jgi:hypothetical protein